MARLPESVLRLGPRKALVGILTHATGDVLSDGTTCVVILNAGIIHRVGPNRLHVELARALAASGLAAVRLDLSGIGDSEPRTDALNPFDGALADIREALDTLEGSLKASRFIVLGLCSGANQAVASAATDERIVAVGLIDPFIPRTRRYYLNHYLGRISRIDSWKNLFRGDHPIWRVLKVRAVAREVDTTTVPVGPDPAEVQRFLARVYGDAIKRGVRIFAAFTGDLELQHNYREQLLDAFPKVIFGERLNLHFFQNADHTFSSSVDRIALVSMLTKWASGR